MGSVCFRKILVACLVAFAVSVALLVALSFCVFYGDFGEDTISAMVVGISTISVVFAGFILARNIENGGLLNGLVMSIIYCAVLVALSFGIHGSVAFDWGNLSRLMVILAAGMLGGVVGINSVG